MSTDRYEKEPWRKLARLRLAPLPTPLVPLERFGREIGVEVWMKRDDVGSIGLAGNKVRKLEFLLADARRQGADVVVMQGSQISNANRATAAAAAQAGMRCVLVLAGDVPSNPTGNLLLDGLFGAELKFVGDLDWDGLEREVQETKRRLTTEGSKPVGLPVGCSAPLGTVGFVAAYLELLNQLTERGVEAESVYHASSSGGTHAGMVLGREIARNGPRARGIGVAGSVYPDMEAAYGRLARGAASLLGFDPSIVEDKVCLDMGHLGVGYGEPTPEALEAIELLARTEGILTDPVYTGKALAALMAAANGGLLNGPVVFWHTGGVQGIFHPLYGDTLWNHLNDGDPPFAVLEPATNGGLAVSAVDRARSTP